MLEPSQLYGNLLIVIPGEDNLKDAIPEKLPPPDDVFIGGY